MLNIRTDKIRLLICFIVCIFILMFICFNSISSALDQWPAYNGSFFNSTFSPYNLIYNNSSVLSSFGGLGYRGSESIGNYVNVGFNNSYPYSNFGNIFPSTFFSFPGSFSGGLYGRLSTGLPNYNTFSPGTFSPLITNTSLSPGLWTNPSPWTGSIFTGNNFWPGIPNIWSIPFPGRTYTSPYPYPRVESNRIKIVYTDGLLEERVRDALGLGSNESITTEKALTLTSLNAKDMCREQLILQSSPYGEPTHEIKCEPLIDITLLEELTNLIELDLSMNTIEDISPLAKLTNLEKLSIHTTNTSDLHPLAGLTNLTYLDIHKAEVDDISPLAGLTNLETLRLHSNKISDISPLSGLTNLKVLILDNNKISDISPLAGLTNLKTLYLGINEISDISPLAGLTNLETLELQSNNLDSGDCPDINALRSRGVSVTIWISDNFSCE